MAARQNGANEVGIFVGKVNVEGLDGGQTAVDGGGFALQRSLVGDEGIYVGEGNFLRWAIPNEGGKLFQVGAVILPGVGVGVAAADRIDKTFNFIEHNKPPNE